MGGGRVLSPDVCVSMNIWGFHHALLPAMQDYFDAFLKGLQPDEIKAECLLPIMVNDFLGVDKISVRAKESHDRWFGITYREDREDVMRELLSLHEKKVYPQNLYSVD